MENSVYISLKSGKNVAVDKFKYITYPSNSGHVTIKNFEEFYLYNKLLTFVGESSIVTINSTDIEFIKFSGNFNE